MRSSIFIAFGLLAAFVPVSAIFRPGGYGGGHRPPPSYGGGHSDDCKSSDAPVVTSTTPVPTTPTTPAKVCPDGFRAAPRTPSALNSQTSIWCMQLAFSSTPIKIEDGAALCKTLNAAAVPTMFENDSERSYIINSFLTKMGELGLTRGSFGVDGKRVAQCISRDQAVLTSEECSQTKAFVLTDPHTDPTWAWSHWAQNEPSANAWTYDIEECIQFAFDPQNSNRTIRLNDFYCNMDVAPNDPTNTVYWNYGTLCGMLPQ